jgi:hypothetical protein
MVMPRTRFAPFSFRVSRMSSGFVGRKFEGESADEICLT